MTKPIESEVVALDFDARLFRSGIEGALKDLQRMKKELHFEDSIRGFSDLTKASRGVNFRDMGGAIEAISNKLSVLGVIGATIVSNITTSVLKATKDFLYNSVLNPLIGGMGEFELQMNSIQTILANTASKGTDLADVTAALDELNEYADRTIYNFGAMTDSIGKFTTAGVALDVSVAAIKGISNLAAVSGATSQQASNAMYQLSQAISTGVVKLQDWNSVVNAGLGGEIFQNALMETARVHNVAVDQMVEDNGSFRASLQEGWLSSDILLETLSKFTGDLTEAQLTSLGYTEEQIKGIMELGEMANDAATKVKTYTQLRDTMQEALESGWALSWRLIIGDFEQARDFFTNISGVFDDLISTSADSRNSILYTWNALGGRTALLDTVNSALGTLLSYSANIKEAIRDIFPATTGNQLYDFTLLVQRFVEGFKLGSVESEQFKDGVRGVAAAVDIVILAFKAFTAPLVDFVKSLLPAGDGILSFVSTTGNMVVNLRDVIKETDFFGGVVSQLGEKLTLVVTYLKGLVSAFLDLEIVQDVISYFKNLTRAEVDKLFERVTEQIQAARVAFFTIIGILKEFKDRILDLDVVQKFIDYIQSFDGSKIKNLFSGLGAGFLTFESITTGLENALDGIFNLVRKLSPIFFSIGTAVSTSLGTVFDEVTENARNFDFVGLLRVINTGLVTAILGSLASLTRGGGFLKNLIGDSDMSLLESAEEVFDGLLGTLNAWQNTLKADTLLKIAGAIGLVTLSVVALSYIDKAKLTGALSAITVMMLELFGGAGVLSVINLKNVTKTSIALLGLSTSLLFLALAVKALGSMDGQEISKGLIAIGIGLAELIIAVRALGAGSSRGLIKAAVGLGVLSLSLVAFALAVKAFSLLSLDELGRGLVGVAGGLTAFIAFTKLVDSRQVLASAIGVGIFAGALYVLSMSLADIGQLSWDQIAKGLAGIGGSLLIIIAAIHTLPPNMIVQAVGLGIVAGALVLLADSVGQMGGMSWDEIGRGLAVLGGSLLILTIALYAMTGTIAGAAALTVVSVGLLALAEALKKMGSMSWDEILRALVALAGAFVVIGLAGLVLTPLVPTLIGLGAAMLLVGLGAAALGAGVFLVSIGLTALAASAAAIAAGLTLVAGAVIGLIPAIVHALGVAIIEFLTVLAEGAPLLFEAAKKLILGLLDAIVEIAPQIFEAAFTLVMGLLQTIADHLPDFLETGFEIIKALQKGLADNIQEIVEGGIDIVVNFIKGISEKLPDVIDAAFGLILSFIEGLTAGVEEYMPQIIAATTDLALAFVEGFINGVIGGYENVKAAVIELGQGAVNALKEVLGIQSPARVTDEAGQNTWMGFVNGLYAANDEVLKAIEGLVDSWLAELESRYKEFRQIGTDYITQLANGFVSQGNKERPRMLLVITQFLDRIRGLQNRFLAVGTILMTALANGVLGQRSRLLAVAKMIFDALIQPFLNIDDVGYDIGESLVDGIVRGIRDNASRAIAAARALAQSVKDATRDAYDSHSPSREFMRIAEDLISGLVIGLADNASSVLKAITSLTSDVQNGMSSFVADMNSIIDSELNFQPVITPVLDSNGFLSSARDLNSFFGGQVATSAIKIDNAQRDANRGFTVSGGERQAEGVTFVQNNYSPKALSSTEIFRRTNSQLARLRRRVLND